MEVLVIGSNKYLLNDIMEFFIVNGYKTYYALNNRTAISILEKHSINLVIFDFFDFNDIKLIKYINVNHKNIEVIVSTNKRIKELLSTIKTSNYTMLQEPFRLDELKHFIENK